MKCKLFQYADEQWIAIFLINYKLLLLYKIYVLSKKVPEHGLADSSIKHKL